METASARTDSQPRPSIAEANECTPGAAGAKRSLADLAIIVYGPHTGEAALSYALALAASFSAHLEVLLGHHVPAAPIPPGPGSGWLISRLREQAKKAAAASEQTLRRQLDQTSVPHMLRRHDGSSRLLAAAAVELAGTCDLVVLPQQGEYQVYQAEVLEALLFEARAGVLIVPEEWDRPYHHPATILIAWRDTPECARATATALPFLVRADTVILVSVREDDLDEERWQDRMAKTAEHLRRHGVSVDQRPLPPTSDVTKALFDEALTIGADLIVAGAYGHSRLREMILGGATRTFLECARVPLLTAH